MTSLNAAIDGEKWRNAGGAGSIPVSAKAAVKTELDSYQEPSAACVLRMEFHPGKNSTYHMQE